MITQHHLEMLAASGITAEHAEARGYGTITDLSRLRELGFARRHQRVPGLLVPGHRIDGSIPGYQYRPDNPAPSTNGRPPAKYVSPSKQPNYIDVPPGAGPKLADPNEPLWITEGSKKADCAVLHGLCCVSINGVWGWRGKNNFGANTAVADFNDIALSGRRVILAFDGDVARKPEVHKALTELARYLESKGARVEYLHLPDTEEKTGLDDYLANDTVDDLWRLVKPNPPVARRVESFDSTATKDSELQHAKQAVVDPISLEDAHEVFHRWLGEDYDADTLDAMLAAVAAERLDGDPIWLLIISGSGNAKTETVQALDGIGATVTSTLTSDAALLSATPRRERTQGATGGLLRKIGDRGVLVIKDVTSILTMNRDMRARVLAALREIYDGRWYREVGADGGHTIPWTGRIAVIGAVTTAWDTAHSVIATMGDRFVLVRADSTKARRKAGRQAIRNTGQEEAMRAELAVAVAGVIAGMSTQPVTVTEDETETLLAAADLVTLARTGVEYDYRGDVIEAHAPEMPTRFAKQLTQIVRAGVAIGMDREDALRLAIRCARDSMPPLRLAIIDDLAAQPHSSTGEVRRRLGKPRNTVDRQLQALHMLGVLTCEEVEVSSDRSRRYYTLAESIDPTALLVPEMSVHTLIPKEECVSESRDARSVCTDISGTNGQSPSPTESARIRQNIIDGYDR
jgi:Domain of unknown function (DUF3854)